MHGQNSGESGSSRDSLLNGIPLETEDLVIDSHDKGAKRGGVRAILTCWPAAASSKTG